jgi:uncharacterized membrane protein YiaA
MRVSMRERLHRVLSHPALQLVVGLAMMGSGVLELGVSMSEVSEVGSAHGVALFGAIHSVKSLIELLEGLEKVQDVKTLRQEKDAA